MRIDGRRPSARLVGVIAVAFEISRIIASIFLTMSPCSASSGSRIVGICVPPSRLARVYGSPITCVAAPAYHTAYAYGGEYGAPARSSDRQGGARLARARFGRPAAGHQRAGAPAERLERL